MEYLKEIEEAVFEPQFGYGYEPDAEKKKKKKKETEQERFKGMKKPLANPLLPLLVSLLFAAVLIACVLLASLSPAPMTRTGRLRRIIRSRSPTRSSTTGTSGCRWRKP